MYVFIYLYSFCINYTGHQCKTVTLLIDLSCINKFIYLFIYLFICVLVKYIVSLSLDNRPITSHLVGSLL